MNAVYILIPCLAAFTGWLVVWLLFKILFKPHIPVNLLLLKIQGIIPKNQNAIIEKIADTVQYEFLKSNFIENKVADATLFEKILPQVETHIDDFLNNKLKQSMPVISMFIGEKTVTQLKVVFLEELKTLFPEIMKNYVQQIKSTINIGEVLKLKLASFTPAILEAYFVSAFSKQIITAQLIGTLTGLLVGILQLLLLWYL